MDTKVLIYQGGLSVFSRSQLSIFLVRERIDGADWGKKRHAAGRGVLGLERESCCYISVEPDDCRFVREVVVMAKKPIQRWGVAHIQRRKFVVGVAAQRFQSRAEAPQRFQ